MGVLKKKIMHQRKSIAEWGAMMVPGGNWSMGYGVEIKLLVLTGLSESLV
jgi:hypothetical protein